VTPRTGGGRWSALPAVERDPTLRAHASAQVLLERHGVLTRAVAPAEGVVSRFRDVYRVLGELEERGAVRRGYFLEGLGGSQFALPGAVDQLRSDAADRDRGLERSRQDAELSAGAGGDAPLQGLLLAATDPANPYGAAVAWPRPPHARGDGARSDGALSDGARSAESGAHRPGRKAGAVVVLVDGELVLFVERGARTVLSFARGDAGDAARLAAAARTLAAATREGRLGRVTVQRVDGVPALTAARAPPPGAAPRGGPRVGEGPRPPAPAGRGAGARSGGGGGGGGGGGAGGRRPPRPAAAALLDAGFGVTPRGLRPS
jgi:ATP-dependent helicase Lhr and Lhr-like helicase